MSRERVYPVFLPRSGCPQECLFCDQRRISGTRQPPTPSQVAAWLEARLPACGDGEIAFFGGSFTLLPEELQQDHLAVARRFVRAGRVAGIRVSTRPDGLQPQQLAGLGAAGVTTVEVGCQSFSDRVLQRSGRGHDAACLQRGLADLARSGLRVGLQLMPGLPGGDLAEALASLNAALSWRPAFLRIYPALVLRGTGLADLLRAGRFRPLSLEEGVDWSAEMLMRCELAGVPVIRLGLLGDPHWSAAGSPVLAGPWHPAFGQLVQSRIWLRLLEAVLPPAGKPIVQVPRRRLSDLVGQRRQNLQRLQQVCPGMTLKADPGLDDNQFGVGATRYERLAVMRRLVTEEPYVVSV